MWFPRSLGWPLAFYLLISVLYCSRNPSASHFGNKYAPQGIVKKPHLHFAFAFATMQLLFFFLKSQTILHRSMDHDKCIAVRSPRRERPSAPVPSVLGVWKDQIWIQSSHLVLLILLFRFAVVIILVLPMMPIRWCRWALPLILSTPTGETMHGAFIVNGMRRSIATLR